jgi:hypothetical protein
MRQSWLLSRRTLLRGAGVALALPLLETMGWADPPKGGRVAAPTRLAFIYSPFGVQASAFWPKDAGALAPAGALPPTLQPLRAVLSDCLLIDGLDNKACRKRLPSPSHGMEVSGWLTGVQGKGPAPKTDALNATSADQLAARVIGQFTVLPSLEMNCSYGVVSTSDKPEDGYPDIYKHCLSWRSPTQPNMPEFSPRAVMNRLFSSRRGQPARRGGPPVDVGSFAKADATATPGERTLDQSMLDVVMASTGDLKQRVSIADRRTLDQYLDSVRSLEQRVAAIEQRQAEAARAQPAATGGKSSTYANPIEVKIPDREYAKYGNNATFVEIMTLMSDLMILALQTDTTRVVTLMTSSGYGRSYPELGFSNSHHELTHHNHTDQAMIEKVLKIEQLHMQQLAYVVSRMKSLQDGAGSLLDHSMVLWGSGMGDGAMHTHARIPAILAGRGGGTVKTGRVLKVNATQSDLLTSILARVGVRPEPVLGDSTKTIEL